jgi:hypothetical protein
MLAGGGKRLGRRKEFKREEWCSFNKGSIYYGKIHMHGICCEIFA